MGKFKGEFYPKHPKPIENGDGTTMCHGCGENFVNVSQHWRQADCPYPSIEKEKIEIIEGLLLGDGCIAYLSPDRPKFQIASNRKEFLKWLQKFFGWFSTTISKSRDEGSVSFTKSPDGKDQKAVVRRDVYQLLTRAHPDLAEIRERWYPDGEKRLPDDIEMSSTKMKMWYIGDGTFSQKSISIASNTDFANRGEIFDLFRSSEVPKPDRAYERRTYKSYKDGVDYVWNMESAKEVFELMGEPPAGFEYKWPKE